MSLSLKATQAAVQAEIAKEAAFETTVWVEKAMKAFQLPKGVWTFGLRKIIKTARSLTKAEKAAQKAVVEVAQAVRAAEIWCEARKNLIYSLPPERLFKSDHSDDEESEESTEDIATKWLIPTLLSAHSAMTFWEGVPMCIRVFALEVHKIPAEAMDLMTIVIKNSYIIVEALAAATRVVMLAEAAEAQQEYSSMHSAVVAESVKEAERKHELARSAQEMITGVLDTFTNLAAKEH